MLKIFLLFPIPFCTCCVNILEPITLKSISRWNVHRNSSLSFYEKKEHCIQTNYIQAQYWIVIKDEWEKVRVIVRNGEGYKKLRLGKDLSCEMLQALCWKICRLICKSVLRENRAVYIGKNYYRFLSFIQEKDTKDKTEGGFKRNPWEKSQWETGEKNPMNSAEGPSIS